MEKVYMLLGLLVEFVEECDWDFDDTLDTVRQVAENHGCLAEFDAELNRILNS